MRFRFCGEVDCPDWILAEINTLARLSSVKLKLLTQLVARGIVSTPPPDVMKKAEQLFSDSKSDVNSIDLKACIACLSYIITSTTRFNCDTSALHSELQQLGLPREHSTSIKRVIDSQLDELIVKFKSDSLRINPLEKFVVTDIDPESNCVELSLDIGGRRSKVTMTSFTLNIFVENLKEVREKMELLRNNSSVGFH